MKLSVNKKVGGGKAASFQFRVIPHHCDDIDNSSPLCGQ